MNCFNYKGYQGSINVSVEDNCLHEKAAKKASQLGKTLNDYIEDIVQKDTESVIYFFGNLSAFFPFCCLCWSFLGFKALVFS